jgi:hypothetical protein
VNLLDSLMNLAGELVLGRNQLVQAIGSKDNRATEAAGQRLDLITTELQEAIMLTRMQPIGTVFNKFPRVVRDLARSLGKQIELVIEGKDVELDKTIIEAINDPLTHLVRNSVDHGIEAPEDRKQLETPPAVFFFGLIMKPDKSISRSLMTERESMESGLRRLSKKKVSYPKIKLRSCLKRKRSTLFSCRAFPPHKR